MTPLRQKMIREMDLKNLSPHTRRSYLNAVTGLSKHYQRPPDTINTEMVEDYLLYLKNDKGLALSSCRCALNGLRFFYAHILDQPLSVGFSLPQKPRKLPTEKPPPLKITQPLRGRPGQKKSAVVEKKREEKKGTPVENALRITPPVTANHD